MLWFMSVYASFFVSVTCHKLQYIFHIAMPCKGEHCKPHEKSVMRKK
jgi:hypothetical protein